MGVKLLCDQDIFLFEFGDDGLTGVVLGGIHAGEETEFGEETCGLVERGEHGEAELDAKDVVDIAASGGDMDDACALSDGDDGISAFVAAAVDDAVGVDGGFLYFGVGEGITAGDLLCLEFIERPTISQAHEIRALDGADDFVSAAFFEDLIEGFEFGHAFDPILLVLFFEALKFEVFGREYINFAVLIGTDFNIIEIGVDCGGDITGERPRRGGPCDEVFALVSRIDEREFDEQGERRNIFTALDDFHLRVGGSASSGPRHDIVSAVNQAFFMTFLQKRPDCIIIFLTHREV